MNVVVVCYDDFFLVPSEKKDRKQTENEGKEGGKWWEREETYTEYDDMDIPLVMPEGEYPVLKVKDTEDVYSMPTHSPRKKR